MPEFLGDNTMATHDGEEENHVNASLADDTSVTMPTPVCTRQVALRAGGMYFGYATMGTAHGLIGLTLLELEIQTSAGLSQLTQLLMWSFVGRLVGASTASAVFDRIHPDLQLGLALLVSALAFGAVPWSPIYPPLIALFIIQGCCIGFYGTGCSARCFELWPPSKFRVGPLVQALYFAFSIGAAVTPPIVSPFLSEIRNSTEEIAPSRDGSLNVAKILNSTNDVQKLRTSQTNYNISSKDMMDPDLVLNKSSSPGLTFLHRGTFYPFLILAVIQVINALYLLMMFALDRCRPLRKKSADGSAPSASKQRTKVRFLVLFAAIVFCSTGIETTFGSLLYTYAVKHLSWSIDDANSLAFAYWVAFASSRALGMVHARFIPPEIALIVFITLMNVAFIVMSISSHISPYVMWVFAPCIGIALSTQIASLFLYAGRFITISGRISGIFMASLYFSGIANPALTSYLFKNISMQWFLYVQVLFAIVMLGLFITVRICAARQGRPPVLSEVEVEEKHETERLNNSVS